VTPADPAHRAGIVSIAPPDPVAASARLEAARIIHSLREGAIRFSPHWAITGAGCVTEGAAPSSWVHLTGLAPGRTEVRQALRGTLCPTS